MQLIEEKGGRFETFLELTFLELTFGKWSKTIDGNL
jgi:hypothetical protein